mgnify:CR=1 FL=1
MQNLLKAPMLSNSSEFSMQLELGKKAILEILGYAIRLTKAGKLKFPKLPTGNLSDSDITKVKERCAEDDIPFSGKGGMVYQVTAYKNADTNHEFINSFNPNCAANEIIKITVVQVKNAAGEPQTYTNTNGDVLPSITLKIEKEEEEEEKKKERKEEKKKKKEESDEVKNAKLGVEAES